MSNSQFIILNSPLLPRWSRHWNDNDADRVLRIDFNDFLIAPLMMLHGSRFDPVGRHLAQVHRELIFGGAGNELTESNFTPRRFVGAANDRKGYDCRGEDFEMSHRPVTLAAPSDAVK